MMKRIKLGDRWIGQGEPCYLIAEIGSNFNGSLERAKKLIDLAKSSGADAVKFQCFATDKIISKEGFQDLLVGFQAQWGKSVYQVYKDAQFPRHWHNELFSYTKSKGMDFLSSPYDREAVDILDELGVGALKIGSGDITWLEMVKYIASKGKPVIIGAGASTIQEIDEAVKAIRSQGNQEIVLLQCVTNYPSCFESANIRAMEAMGEMFDVLVGYSDHTPGSIVPLGAVALGACIIEKHFTDDKTLAGPDHAFAMDNNDFKEMADSIRLLEKALGTCEKSLYSEESETVILQRRCLRAAKDIFAGEVITKDKIAILRPLAGNCLAPKYENDIIRKKVKAELKKGDPFTWDVIA
jgi:sialic acid synthase SpsE